MSSLSEFWLKFCIRFLHLNFGMRIQDTIYYYTNFSKFSKNLETSLKL